MKDNVIVIFNLAAVVPVVRKATFDAFVALYTQYGPISKHSCLPFINHTINLWKTKKLLDNNLTLIKQFKLGQCTEKAFFGKLLEQMPFLDSNNNQSTDEELQQLANHSAFDTLKSAWNAMIMPTPEDEVTTQHNVLRLMELDDSPDKTVTFIGISNTNPTHKQRNKEIMLDYMPQEAKEEISEGNNALQQLNKQLNNTLNVVNDKMAFLTSDSCGAFKDGREHVVSLGITEHAQDTSKPAHCSHHKQQQKTILKETITTNFDSTPALLELLVEAIKQKMGNSVEIKLISQFPGDLEIARKLGIQHCHKAKDFFTPQKKSALRANL